MFLRSILFIATGVMLSACASGPGSSPLTDPAAGPFLKAASTWDFDRDGTVTCQEWKGYAARLFKGADKNSDGSLDAAEYNSLSSRDRLFDSVPLGFFDANGDQRLSQQEFVDKPNPAFAYLDTNKDCGLTIAELTVVPTKKKASTLSDKDLFPNEARGNMDQ